MRRRVGTKEEKGQEGYGRQDLKQRAGSLPANDILPPRYGFSEIL